MKSVQLYSLVLFVSTYAVADDRGHFHSEITQNQPTGAAHIVNPPQYQSMDDRSKDSPGNYGPAIITIPPGQGLDHLENGPLSCQSGGGGNGCDFIDFVNLTDIGGGQVQYTGRNHGGRATFTLKIYTKDLKPVVTKTDEHPWTEGKTFLVQVPLGAAAIVVGTFDGNAVIFAPSDPLSPDDSKRFKLIRTITQPTENDYVFQVLDQGQPTA